MENKKITIVTAFFPLKRENWNGFERPNNKYLEYFEFWSKIQNDMIIYTDNENAKYISDIRKNKYNRKNTEIIVIDDWKKIDCEVYEKIQDTMKSQLAINFKMNPTFPESWNADYNYMTNMKSWFVQDAIKRKKANGMIAWIDFGFNHGGEYYIKSDEFDFKWEYNFENKINLFTINPLDDLPIFEICRRMNSYIQGNVMVAPDYLWSEFWNLVRNSIIELADIGLSDDDQTMTLMAYRKNKQIFNLLPTCKWFSMIDEYGEKKFTIATIQNRKDSKMKKLKKKMSHRKKLIKYFSYWYKILRNEEMKG